MPQTIEWEDYEGNTGIKIICDTPNIPVYVNNARIGVTPIERIYNTPEGWHWVSLFPAVENSMDTPQRAKDIISLGSKKVLVRQGEVSTVSLMYRSLDIEADELSAEKNSSAIIGYSMFLFLLIISIWGLG